MHPKESGINRRQLLRRSAVAAVGLSAAGALAGCENTTTPIGAADAAGEVSKAAAELVVPKPLGPAGLPLPRPDNSVTWAITDDNKPIADGGQARGRPAADLQLRRLRRPGDGQEVPAEVQREGPGRDLQLVRRGDREARVRGGELRPHHGPERLEHRRPDRAQAAQAAQPLLPAQPREEHLARAGRPVLRPRRALHGPVRRLDGRDRLAQRQGQGGRREHGRPVGHLLAGAGLPRPGRDPRRPARRAQHADAARRDATRRAARPQHRGRGASSTRRRRDLSELGAICNPKVTITDYQTLPEGKTVLHHSWSGDVLGGAFYYMPKGVPPSVLSFWGPDQNGVVQNDFFCVGRTAKSPALAHEFINFFLDEKNAYDELRQLHRLHPAAEEHRRGGAPEARADPEVARAGRRPPGPVRGQPGAAAAERRRGSASGTTPGRSSRSADGRLALDVAAARAARRRVAVRLLPRRPLRGPGRRLRQPGHALPARPVLEPAGLERRLRARDAEEHLARRPVPDRLAAHDRVRGHRGRAVAARRLSGGVLHRAPRGALEGPRPARR